MQYIQIYNEKIYDLLNKSTQKMLTKSSLGKDPGLKLKWNVATDEVSVENAYKFQCESVEDAFAYFHKGS